jgi:hypothetical protein
MTDYEADLKQAGPGGARPVSLCGSPVRAASFHAYDKPGIAGADSLLVGVDVRRAGQRSE